MSGLSQLERDLAAAARAARQAGFHVREIAFSPDDHIQVIVYSDRGAVEFRPRSEVGTYQGLPFKVSDEPQSWLLLDRGWRINVLTRAFDPPLPPGVGEAAK